MPMTNDEHSEIAGALEQYRIERYLRTRETRHTNRLRAWLGILGVTIVGLAGFGANVILIRAEKAATSAAGETVEQILESERFKITLNEILKTAIETTTDALKAAARAQQAADVLDTKGDNLVSSFGEVEEKLANQTRVLIERYNKHREQLSVLLTDLQEISTQQQQEARLALTSIRIARQDVETVAESSRAEIEEKTGLISEDASTASKNIKSMLIELERLRGDGITALNKMMTLEREFRNIVEASQDVFVTRVDHGIAIEEIKNVLVGITKLYGRSFLIATPAHVRSSADSDSQELDYLKAGTPLVVVGKKGNWYQIVEPIPGFVFAPAVREARGD
jgi:hypothetical protein